MYAKEIEEVKGPFRNYEYKSTIQSPISVQVERFWSSERNQESIEALSNNYLTQKYKNQIST